MKILLTGGAGFMGSAFVRLFAEGGFPRVESLIVFDSLTYAGDLSRIQNSFNQKISFIQGDITDSETVNQLMSQVDVCVNYAAETHVDNSIKDPKIFVKTNVLGTEVLLEAAVKNKISKFLQISTDEVYGEIDSGEWDEESSLDPSSPYSASKLSADLLVKAFFKTYKLPTVITRSCNNFGPFQNNEKFIPKVISSLIQGREFPIYGNGANIREWLHVNDHAQSTYLALINGIPGEIYNIGSGNRITNLELAQKIIEKMNASSKLIKYVEDRLGHDFRYAVNSSKAKKILNFSHKIDLDTGLSEIIKISKSI